VNFAFPTITRDFYLAVLPVLILCGGGLVAMMQAVFKRIGGENAVFGVLIVSLLGSLVACFGISMPDEVSYLNGAYLAGELSRFGQGLILVIATVVAIAYRDTFLKAEFFRGEIAALYLMIVAGMLVMVASDDMVTLFTGLELSSIGLYAVVGYLNPSRRSQEGAIKYFILGSFASAFLLFGFALLYASTGTMQLADVIEAAPRLADHPWMQLGTLFTVVGLGFKLALAPFHLWAPDTYEAAPTGITAFMATSVKTMILVVTMRLFAGGLSSLYESWLPAMMFLAMLSMILGNIMALVQSSLKRLLAYSSIAHSGYMAIAVCAIAGSPGDFPVAAILFYLVTYALISLGAFTTLMWLENANNDNLLLDDLSGLAKRHPWASAVMTIFLFAFAGMPPTAGFMGKFFVFNAALANHLYGLVVIGVIGSSISMYYYLRIIVRMYMADPVKTAVPLAPQRSLMVTTVLTACVVMVVLLGTLLPGPTMRTLSFTSRQVAGRPLPLDLGAATLEGDR
jgi:NADH-quinone oxidoreductase subunit N